MANKTTPVEATSVVPLGPPVSASQRSSRRYVEVSSKAFVCGWLFVALLHATCASYFFGVAYGYWITTPTSPLARMLNFYRLGIDIQSYRTVALAHGAIGACHVTLLGFMVVCSVYRRRCCFTWDSYSTGRQKTGHSVKRIGSTERNRGPCPRIVRYAQAMVTAMVAIFGRTGILGVEGPYFEAQVLVLKLVETVLQSYQAHRMSQHVPRPWLNSLLVGLLVVNCVFTPLLHHVFKYNSLARRATCLAIDVVLDLVSSVVVPASLMVLYSTDYAASSGVFNTGLWLNDTWFVNASNEFQLILVTSWGDLAARMVVSLGFIASLESAKSLVRVGATRRVAPGIAATVVCDQRVVTTVSPHRWSFSSARGWLQQSARGRQVRSVAHGVLATWGIVILAFHLHAASVPQTPVCAMQVRPWLQTKPACALFLIDCQRKELQHLTEDEMREYYQAVDPHRVVRLLVRHCLTLQVPTAIQALYAMTAIKIYNSTLVDWPRDAALTATHHPVLKTISLVRVTFQNGHLPDGLTDIDFPKHVTSILICVSNLRALSPDLATRWPQYAYFLFEHSQFETFPSVLTELNPLQVSFAENQFTQFPFEALSIPTLRFLNMGGNRGISSLVPTAATDPVSLPPHVFISVAHTNVSVLPDWFDDRLRPTVKSPIPQYYPVLAAGGTPLCTSGAQIITGALSSFPERDRLPADQRSFVMEFTHADAASLLSMSLCWPLASLYYPLSTEDASNRT